MDRVRRSYRRKSDTLESICDWSRQLIEAADEKATALLLIDTVIISFCATWNLRECCAHVKVVMVVAIVLGGILQAVTSIST
jgi:hypothetical protein